MVFEKTVNNYFFSTDKKKLHVKRIHQFLSKESYWAQNIPLQVVKSSIKGSLCFGVYFEKEQIGFARVITDYASFGYLADVYIEKKHRAKGIGKELMQFIMGYPQLQAIRRFMLATKDAHGLYRSFGFTSLAEPLRFMEIKSFETYLV